MDYAKVRYLIASRIYQDMLSYMERMLQLSKSLTKDPAMTELQTRRFLRVNRNSNYLRHTHHFHSHACLGAGGFGRVDLVTVKNAVIKKFYAIKTMFVRTAGKRANYHCLAQVERDIAILGSECPFLMTYKAVWMECNYDDRPDAYKFLMPAMQMGSFKNVFRQLHPYVKDDAPLKFPNFEEVDDSIPEEDPLRQMKVEVKSVKGTPGMQERFRHIYARYMMQMVLGVSYLHNHGVVHHDIKPDNFLVNDNLDLKLADYGLCSGLDSEYQELYELSHWAKHPADYHEPWPSSDLSIAARSPVDLRRRSRQYKLDQTSVTQHGGTRFYKAPEQFREYYEMPGNENTTFPFYHHYAADWFAVGMTFFDLIAGVDLFRMCLKVFPDCAQPHQSQGGPIYDDLLCLKINEGMNPFLNANHPVQAEMDDLLIDVRFMKVVRHLLRSDPYQRMNHHNFQDDADLRSLSEGVAVEGTKLWHFNEFYGGDHVPSYPQTKCIKKQEARVQDGEPTFVPPREHATMPHIASFAFMTGSPEIVASPVKSPTKRMRLTRRRAR